MARRMFSDKIVDTDAFLDMPQSSQNLYFHLNMKADDDGFVSNPKKIMRSVGSSEDDFKILCVKKFIIPFQSGVCVIKHWLIHNLIRQDRYTPTQYIREKDQLVVDRKTKKYSLNKGQHTDVIPYGNQMAPQESIVKESIGKKKELTNKEEGKNPYTMTWLKALAKKDTSELRSSEDGKFFTDKYVISITQIKSEADKAINWLESAGKTWKNHRSGLSNWIGRNHRTQEEAKEARV